MSNFIRRLWLRRWFRGCAWLAITLFTALILLRQYAGWSGARHWAAVQGMLAREGESLDFRAIAPEPVPDEQNFFAIPPLKDLSLCSGRTDDKSELGLKLKRLTDAWPPNASKAGPKPKLLQGASFGTATDLKAWADWLRKDGSLPPPPDSGDPARDVLAALSKDDALISELALGLNRPESQWTPAWKTRVLPEDPFAVRLPHYMPAGGLAAMLCLRSAAAARVGDAVKAHESLLIAERLNQANMKEPSIIGVLVVAGESERISGAIWELCDAHVGTAEDLRTLQEELSRLNFHASLLLAARGEIATVEGIDEDLKRAAINPNSRTSSGVPPLPLLACLIPGGWFDANAAAYTQWCYDYLLKPLRDAGFKELVAKQKELEALITDHRTRYYRHVDELLALAFQPGLWELSRKVVYTQSIVNEAIAACDLERYRIEHNTYPDTLEAANRPGEKSIPPDVISGKPMGYRKTPDGRYALWCFGFDGTDHGGKRVLDAKKPELTKFNDAKYPGDWVWDFPAK